MRSNGFATFLLMIPILAVPAMAIFGIPQLTPVDPKFTDSRDDAGESRTGRLSRQSRDDLFGDFEDLNSDEVKDKEESSQPKRQKEKSRALSSTSRNGAARRKSDDSLPSWEDDLESELANDTKGRNSSIAKDDMDDLEPAEIPKNSKKNRSPDRASRSGRQKAQNDDPIREESKGSSDGDVVQAGFDDELEQEKPKAANKSKRAKSEEPRVLQQGEKHGKLTLQAAMERLNELDIRNFRLESGREANRYIFICSYTPPNTPRVSYRFEAEAEEPLNAIEKVLDQIVEWQQRQ